MWLFTSRGQLLAVDSAVLLLRVQLAEPDIAVAYRIAVVLQSKGKSLRSCFVGWAFAMGGGAGKLYVVLHEHTVVKDGHARGTRQLSCGVKARAVENDVVALPLARRKRGVDQRRILAVDRGSLAVGIRFVLKRIQYLNFIEPVQENAAVPALLALAFWRHGLRKFHVQLAIADRLARGNVAHVRPEKRREALNSQWRWPPALARCFKKILET